MRSWWRVVALVLLVSACGDGGSDGGVSADNLVESADGQATLTLQLGSLPEGVSLEDVQLNVLVDESAELGAPVMAVQLLPDALVLAESATLTVELPDSLADGGFLAMHQSGDFVEFLEGDILQIEGDILFSASVTHFSTVSFTGNFFVDFAVVPVPQRVSVGQVQTITLEATPKENPVVWFHIPSDPEGTFREFKFSTPDLFGVGTSLYDDLTYTVPDRERESDAWEPSSQTLAMSPTPDHWIDEVSSKCLQPNEDWIVALVNVDFSLTLKAKAENPQTKQFIYFSHVLSGDSGEPPIETTSGMGRFNPGTAGKDDPFPKAQGIAVVWVRTGCTETAVTTSSTTTTTTGGVPPDGDPPGDQDGGTNGSTTGKAPDGGDMVGQIPVVEGAAGEICLKIETVGDSEETATGSDNGINWVDIGVRVVDSGTEGGEWRASVFFGFDGSQTDRGVKLGPPAPGQFPLEGATVSVDWPGNDDTMWLCVFGGDTKLGVETFEVAIGVQTENGDTFWDYATGQAE